MSAAEGMILPVGLADMTPSGLLITLVAFVIFSIFKGWIIVKVHYDVLLQALEDNKITIGDLRETNGVQARTIDKQAGIIDKQTAVGETVIRVMSSVQDAHAASDSS